MYAAKQNNIKNNGQKQHTMNMIACWIEDNLDELWEKQGRM